MSGETGEDRPRGRATDDPEDDPGGGEDTPVEDRPNGDAGGESTARATGDRDSETVLELSNVVREYDSGAGRVRALDGVDLRIDRGESVAVIGPSGSGKSTMLNVLGLLDAPTSGTVRLAGEDATDLDDRERTDARREFLGFVFQDFYLIPTLSARENVTLPTTFDPVDRSARARDLLDRVGLGDRVDHAPDELSGGQKQRVAIARALVNEPAVVLADEPTGNLDTDTGRKVLAEFERIRETGVAVVLVTHDRLVTEYAQRTVELVDGRIDADRRREDRGADGGRSREGGERR
jgi:putative ABC transport system ATP-binding protein